MADTGAPLSLNKPVDSDNARTAMLALATNMQTINDFVATAKANLLVNPGFEVWQRGAGPFTTNGAYTADRWRVAIGAPSTLQIDREGTTRDLGSYAAKVQCVFNTNACWLAQDLEDPYSVRNKTLSFSVRVKANAASVQVQLEDNVGSTNGTTHTGGDGWETLTVTRTIDANATSVTAFIRFGASLTAYVDSAMLVIGPWTEFVPLTPAEDWARCLRYWETLGGADSAIYLVGYSSDAANYNGAQTLTFAARKAVSPVMTRAGTWAVTNCAQPTLAASQSTVSVIVDVTANGMYVARTDSADDSVIAEANP